jgi:hypothetical protein
MQKIKVQLYEGGIGGQAGPMITASGGRITVTANGDAAKATLYNADGSAKTNGFALTNGGAEFYVADSVSSVDCYIMAPGGQFVVKTGVTQAGAEIAVDTQRRNQVAVIPFAIADTTATTETDTGFDLPLYSAVLPTPMVRTLTADATETIDVGLLSSETAGDADGFIVGVSVGTVALVKATVLNGSNTMGALFEVQDSANAGDLTHEAHVVTGSNATSISYTLSAGTDTAEGFIVIPYILTT